MARWLKLSKKMTVVISELQSCALERPDVIGWIGAGQSILIEVKVSRSDFHKDKAKTIRQINALGMGNMRYFAAPKGILVPSDMPSGWGLLEVDANVRVLKEAKKKKSNKEAECILLVRAIRRLELSTAVYVVRDSRKRL
jgi:hypothetical protein